MKKVPLVKVLGSQNKHLFKRGDVFWVRIYKAPKGRLEESLKTTILSDARIARDKRIAEFLGEKPRFATTTKLVEDMFPEFLEIKKTKSKGTYDSIKNQWENHLSHYFGGKMLDEVNETTWLKYVSWRRETHPDRKFFNDRKYLSMFLGWLHRQGAIKVLPKLPNVDPEIAEGKVYTDEQISALLSKATPDLKLQILLALTMGMRIGEIMSLEWDQIDFQKRTIYLPAAKTKIRKERTFGISDVCFEILQGRAEAAISTAVFPSPKDPSKTQGRDGHKKVWSSVKKAAGISKEYRFHWLRHTFLTHAFKASVNPALICEFAGLSIEEAQKTYLHFTVEDTRVVANLIKLG